MQNNERLNDEAEHKRAALETMYSQLFGQCTYYRSAIAKIGVVATTLIVAVTGWADRIEKLSNEQSANFCVIIGIVGGTAFCAILYLAKHLQATALGVHNIEVVFGAFEDNQYLDGKLLHKNWESFGTKKWREPFIVFAAVLIIIAVFLGIALVSTLSRDSSTLPTKKQAPIEALLDHGN